MERRRSAPDQVDRSPEKVGRTEEMAHLEGGTGGARRPRSKLIVSIALVLLAAVSAVVVWQRSEAEDGTDEEASTGESRGAEGTTTSGVAQLTLTGRQAVDEGHRLVVHDDRVWIASLLGMAETTDAALGEEVERVELDSLGRMSGLPELPEAIPVDPQDIAPDGTVGLVLDVLSTDGSLWALTTPLRSEELMTSMAFLELKRLDPDGRVVETIVVGADNTWNRMASGAGSIWIATLTGVLRVDPDSGEQPTRIETGRGLPASAGAGVFWPTVVAATDDRVWVGGYMDDPDVTSDRADMAVLLGIDPSTNEVVDQIELGGGFVADIAVSPAGLWIMRQASQSADGTYEGDDVLSSVDPTSGATDVVVSITPAGTSRLAVAGDRLWVANGTDQTVAVYDATSGELVDELQDLRLDGGVTHFQQVVATEATAWLIHDSTEILRIDLA